MDRILLIEQTLNALQLGVMLFLMAAGLTLVLGIMNFINLAHGVFYMLGAYFAATIYHMTGSFVIAALGAPLATALIGVAAELLVLRHVIARPPLDQVLCTVGLILFFNNLVRIIWGPLPLFLPVPDALKEGIELLPGLSYPAIRLAIIVAGLAVAVMLYVLIHKTRTGMLIRAGASNRMMVSTMGVNISLLFTAVFGLGCAMAGFAGTMAGPIMAVRSGMGDEILILTLVVIVIGGIGSIRGAFVAALLVGAIDTFGRITLPASMGDIGIYVLMALVLFWRPKGLFPAHG
ncbi:branched-chain amino acid ABC transporter permease [Ensifer sp. ENS08]|uniref:branched-chain amino acid ABC transporter permease n=1 Tax=Ensifer sp. ENS08 TaxID=2769273 RepID=UPI00178202FE|nr:branched-chain amino acid ABC transporter permease [Ensifer sp. ENS08]MBD9570787.1 branched-chain amino acid ABC transporter permease [Ensifer sp. ENS08]